MSDDGFHPNLRHVRSTDLDADTAQTAGMRRLSAISAHRVGAEKLWMGQTHVGPAQRSGNHHHGESETAIYVVSGSPEFVFLDEETGAETRLQAGPGDYVYVPPFTPHREENNDPDTEAVVVLARSTQEAIVVNLASLAGEQVCGSNRASSPSAVRDTPGAPVNPPIVLTAPFRNAPENNFYSRAEPTETRAALETALGDLDGGHALAFGSGMAAFSAVVGIQPVGAVAVVPHAAYSGAVAVFTHAEKTGRLSVRRGRHRRHRRGAGRRWTAPSLLWLEAVTNPLMAVPDLPVLIAAAHEAGAMVGVDATFCTPLNVRPLELGADVVMHSATKYLSGHSDVLLGVARGALARASRRLVRGPRALAGAIPGALESYLALRGLRTLALRMERAQANAAELATRLEAHPRVTRVRYPGLAADPGHERATRLFAGYGAMIGFEVDGDARGGRGGLRAGPADHARHQPRRGRVAHRAAGPLRRRRRLRHPAEPAPALGRHRARRGSLGRPRAGPRLTVAGRVTSPCRTSSAVAIAARPSPRPVSPSPSVVVAATDTGAPTAAPSASSASARRGPIFGSSPITCTATLAIRPPGAVTSRAVSASSTAPERAGPPRVGRAEHRAEVAEPGGRQQRVAQRVRGHVAVGVPGAAVGLGHCRPASQHGRPASIGCTSTPMPVRSSGTAHHRLGQARSSGTVILKARSSPRTARTRRAERLDQGCVVGGRGVDAVGVRRDEHVAAEALRGLHRAAARERSISSPSTPVSASTRLMVSTDRQRRDRRASAPASSAAITRPITSSGTNGRAASCTSTRSAPAGTAASASATDCCRVAPAGRPRPRRGPARAPPRACSAGTATTIVRTRRVIGQPRDRVLEQGAPGDLRTNAFGTSAPSREPDPAATRTAATIS